MLISPQELQLYKKLCRNLDKEEGIADFVVDDIYMSAIRKRVNMAREIDALAHQQKKVGSNSRRSSEIHYLSFQ